MAFSLARPTIFIVIDAVERDLNALIVRSAIDTLPLDESLGPDLRVRCEARFAKDNGAEAMSLESAVTYLDLGDKLALLNRNAQHVSPTTVRHIKNENAALSALIPPRNRVFHGRPLKAADLGSVVDLGERLALSAPDIWSELAKSLTDIRDRPESVLGIEIPVEPKGDEPRNNLPTTDFDETGFIGRKKEVDAVMQALLGPFPVVSILGEGGYGKSSVALQVAYELLESDDPPFEAIIWVTAKAATLTGTELRRVENAITTTLGLFAKVAEETPAPPGSDPLSEIIDYLRHFKVLVILDNLETVLDSRVAEFLARLPRGESKVLITSRIGVGAPEFPIRLSPMSEDDAVSLLRATALSRNCRRLVEVANATLKGYCNRLSNNPAWIKWFVSGVQVGKSPEQIFGQPEAFLAFCLSNVYEYLAAPTRAFLSLLQFSKRPVGAPEAALILECNPDELHVAVADALRSNMAVPVSQSSGRSYTSGYELSELARQYLLRHHPVPAELHTMFVARKKKMRSQDEQILNAARLRPYEEDTIRARDAADTVIAKILRDAVRALVRRDNATAIRLTEEARALAPDNCECYRVAASVHARMGDHSEALELFQIAIDIDPTQPTVHFFFARFLTDCLEDNDAALIHYERALELDPSSREVRVGLARLLMFREDFERAIELIHGALADGLRTSHLAKVAFTVLIDCHTRRAEVAVDRGDVDAAYAALDEARRAFTGTAMSLRDSTMRKKLIKAITTVARLRELAERSGLDAEWRARTSELLTWYKLEAADPEPGGAPQSDTFVVGERIEVSLERITRAKGYSHAFTADYRVIFLHKSEFPSTGCWNDSFIGQRLSLTVGMRDGRPVGLGATTVPQALPSVATGIRLGDISRGRIVRLIDGGSGFIELDGGEELFFSSGDVASESIARPLEVGDYVKFRVGVGSRNPRPRATELEFTNAGH